MEWHSRSIIVSKVHPGVEFVIGRMSFGRRVELMKRVRDLAARAEFFEAGCGEENKMEASQLGAEIDGQDVEGGGGRGVGTKASASGRMPALVGDGREPGAAGGVLRETKTRHAGDPGYRRAQGGRVCDFARSDGARGTGWHSTGLSRYFTRLQ